MIRSHPSLAWLCCGVQWPSDYRHCGFCGNGVLTVKRVLLRFPIFGGGDMAVVASADVGAETWAFLAKTVAVTASAFENHAAKQAASMGSTDSPAEAPIHAEGGS